MSGNYIDLSNLDTSGSITPNFVRAAVQKAVRHREENGPLQITYSLGASMLSYLRGGDPEGMLEFFRRNEEELHRRESMDDGDPQKKRITFAVVVALCAFAAVEAGVDRETAFDLCDGYVRYAFALEDSRHILRLCFTCAVDFAQRVRSAMPQLSGPMRQCRDYVRQNLCGKITVTDLAEHCGRNSEYLSQLFRKELGVTPKTYITQQKLAAAMTELATTGNSVSSIAHKYGFGTHSSFSQHFREQYGTSPREFRRSGRLPGK